MKKLGIFLIVLSVALAAVLLPVKPSGAFAVELSDSGINYAETTANVINPDIGFQHMFREYLDDNAVPEEMTLSRIQQYMTERDPISRNNFLISFGLEAYSSRMGGTEQNLTQNALACIDACMKNLREAGATAVVRFSYDAKGLTYAAKSDCEPSDINLIYIHIKQISKVLYEYRDVITAVESGMFGAWGEQHTTTYCVTNERKNFYDLINTWLSNTPNDMFILARRPRYLMDWYNEKNNTNYTTANIDTIPVSLDGEMGRIGCYNDGYLGSQSDTGTYTNRTAEVAFMEKLTYAPMGGEVLENGDVSGTASGIGEWNCCSFIEVEGFKTHTSFLNYGYNYDNVISYWEKQTYSGPDTVYKNKTSEFDYIFNRMGYRLVLREAKLTSLVNKNSVARFEGKIENVGFGSVSKKQNVYLVIAKADGQVVSKTLTDINMRDHVSKTTRGYTASVDASTLAVGEYKAYLKVIGAYEQSGSDMRNISFANVDIYNTSLKANYIGSFAVTDSSASSSLADSSIGSSAPTSSIASSSAQSGEQLSAVWNCSPYNVNWLGSTSGDVTLASVGSVSIIAKSGLCTADTAHAHTMGLLKIAKNKQNAVQFVLPSNFNGKIEVDAMPYESKTCTLSILGNDKTTESGATTGGSNGAYNFVATTLTWQISGGGSIFLSTGAGNNVYISRIAAISETETPLASSSVAPTSSMQSASPTSVAQSSVTPTSVAQSSVTPTSVAQSSSSASVTPTSVAQSSASSTSVAQSSSSASVTKNSVETGSSKNGQSTVSSAAAEQSKAQSSSVKPNETKSGCQKSSSEAALYAMFPAFVGVIIIALSKKKR